MSRQSLPLSSAISIMIISPSIDLAGPAHRKILWLPSNYKHLPKYEKFPSQTRLELLTYLPAPGLNYPSLVLTERPIHQFGGFPGFNMDDTRVQEKS